MPILSAPLGRRITTARPYRWSRGPRGIRAEAPVGVGVAAFLSASSYELGYSVAPGYVMLPMLSKNALAGLSLLLLVATGNATTFISLSTPQSVMRSDVIVAATVTQRTEDSCKLVVSETLQGAAQKEISITGIKNAPFGEGVGGIFYLVARDGGYALVDPMGFEQPARLENVRKVTAMRRAPGKVFRDPDAVASPDFIEMLGVLFLNKETVDGITKIEAIAHLNRCLALPDNDAVRRALVALQALGSKDVSGVIPLIQHPDEAVRLSATYFLRVTPDSAAVAPLCKALDGLQGNLDPNELEITRALNAIGDPSAVPALERAVKRNLSSAAVVLGRLGDESHFELLFDHMTNRDDIGALEGMWAMIERSNIPIEPWMKKVNDDDGVFRSGPLKHKQEWADWWAKNKADFKVAKKLKEVSEKR